MKVLILSCNTGQGHNQVSSALKECYELFGHQADVLDMMQLKSKKTSKHIEEWYLNTIKFIPHLFGFVYNIGVLISCDKHSIVYALNIPMAKYLDKYLKEHHYDVILCPHLYPSLTLTYMKKHHMIDTPVFNIATDYTLIPFLQESKLDGYIVPNDELKEEYLKHHFKEEQVFPYGIPVKTGFTIREENIYQKLNLDSSKKIILVMSGSMGFGRLHIVVQSLLKFFHDTQVIVICGNNQKLFAQLSQINNPMLSVHGYVTNVNEYMSVADIMYTKPGGISTTEAITSNVPIIISSCIPGLEVKNRKFLVHCGCAKHAASITKNILLGDYLLKHPDKLNEIKEAQRHYAHYNTAYNIVKLTESKL